MVGGVEQAGRNLGLVTLTDEAWHIGLYHHVFLGNGLAINVAIEHISSIGNTHKAPCGQTFRECERQGNATIAIGLHIRIAESCLVEVLTNLDGRVGGRTVGGKGGL